MKKVYPFITVLFIATMFFVMGFACERGGGNNGVSNNETAGSGSSRAPSKVDIAGEYDASGTNPDGKGTYKAALTVTPRDDVYQFSWKSGATSYDGVGVMTDNAVAVSYTTGTNGKGCGVVLYKINSDGSLDGKSGYWGVNNAESEKATRTSGGDLEGNYSISGTNTEGKDYKGTLVVTKMGQGYKFAWNAGNSFDGFGIRAGNLVAVGFGGKQCAFVGYDVRPDGTLDGKWGAETSQSLGTEVAKKK
ncbi:MAG: hypothetical protein ACKVQW_10475 [Pyrinomonadaceae bacterium]